MQRHHKNGLEWLEFDLLADCPRVKHALFLRHGGVSVGRYASFNFGRDVGDDPAHVAENERRLKSVLCGSARDRLITGRGVHGTSIAFVDEGSSEEIVAVDGLMTACPHLTLKMHHADCQIAFLYDPIKHVIANIHSGWRGSVVNIYQKAVDKMRQIYNCAPQDLLVCISPSLGPAHAEFIHYRQELPKPFWDFQVRSSYFDFWAITEMQLKEAGVLPHHIEVARVCTHAHPEDFFSHRRDKLTGRHAACITLLR